ncbi:MAG: DUF5053 domain-containing protein [Dysgonamonadaceae bacterium]|jgi:cytidylate kinase|nr:DUF5053 domain-containing protein [Dysgonamonadaceae bacterium]
MDIKAIILEYHDASESQKIKIRENLKNDFSQLSEKEKKEVQRIFLESQNAVIEEGKEALQELKLKTELERVSQFVSMSYIARNFFGKSRQWLNNRIKGNIVNGRPAAFTSDELNLFSTALTNLSSEIKQTALRITH